MSYELNVKTSQVARVPENPTTVFQRNWLTKKSLRIHSYHYNHIFCIPIVTH